MKAIGILALTLAIIFACSVALEVTITASASVTIISNNRVCGACSTMAVSDASVGSLLKFDLSVLPSGSQISQATLNLPIAQQGFGLPMIDIKAAERAWTQSVVTASSVTVGNPALMGDPTWEAASFPYANWTIPGGGSGAALSVVITSSNSPNDSSSYGLSSPSLLSLVQSWKANAAYNFGLSLTVRNGSLGVSYFGSRLHANTTLRPHLEITLSELSATPVDDPPPSASSNTSCSNNCTVSPPSSPPHTPPTPSSNNCTIAPPAAHPHTPPTHIVPPPLSPPTPTSPIGPLGLCYDVSASTGVKSFWFGYNNPNAQTLEIPSGARNVISPSPSAPITSFLPGTHYYVVQAEGRGTYASWVLDGYVVLTSASCQNTSSVSFTLGFDLVVTNFTHFLQSISSLTNVPIRDMSASVAGNRSFSITIRPNSVTSLAAASYALIHNHEFITDGYATCEYAVLTTPPAAVMPTPLSPDSPSIAPTPIAPVPTTPHVHPIVPLGLCYDMRGTGTKSFWFGYRNLNDEMVNISTGPINTVLPSTIASPITSFFPGTNYYVLSTESSTAMYATWVLDGFVVATSSACQNATSLSLTLVFDNPVENIVALFNSISTVARVPARYLSVALLEKRSATYEISIQPNIASSLSAASSRLLHNYNDISDGAAVCTHASLTTAPSVLVEGTPYFPVGNPQTTPTSAPMEIPAPIADSNRILPLGMCYDVSNANGAKTFWFGFNNTNAHTVTIASGSLNAVSPAPSIEITTFSPGINYYATYTESATSSSATWILDGFVVSTTLPCQNSSSVSFQITFDVAVTNFTAVLRCISNLTAVPVREISVALPTFSSPSTCYIITFQPNSATSLSTASHRLIQNIGAVTDGIATAQTASFSVPPMTVMPSPYSASPSGVASPTTSSSPYASVISSIPLLASIGILWMTF